MKEKYAKLLVNLLLWAAGIVLLFTVVPRLLLFFLPLVIGWILAILANPLVRLMEKRFRIVRRHGSMLIIITAIALVVLVLYLIIARLGGEIVGFIYAFPETYARMGEEFTQIGKNLSGVYEQLPDGLQAGLASLGTQFDSYMGASVEEIGRPTVTAAGNFAKNLPSYLLGVVFVILSAYFFIADRERIMKFFRENVPENIQKTFLIATDSIKNAVGGYFKAQFKIMGVVFLILLVGFAVLGIRFAVLIAFLTAFLDFLPFLGTGTVLLPWALFQFLAHDYRMTVGLLVIYAVSQTVRQLIQPKIVGDTVGLSPLATLIWIYIGYKLYGVVGMIVAVPVGVLVQTFYRIGMFQPLFAAIGDVARDINRFRKMEKQNEEQRKIR